MKNHIKAKMAGLVYSPIPKEQFLKVIATLANNLRRKLPNYEYKDLNDIRLNLVSGSVSASHDSTSKELLMVSATGNWGVKIGNTGTQLLTSEYISFPELRDLFKQVMEVISDTLEITHFSRTSLRNINLFKELEGEANKFEHIKSPEQWGRQNFKTLDENYLCSGAATRHEYLSSDYLKHVQVISGIAMENQSYIPQDQWDIWKLFGGVPVVQSAPQLLIDLSSSHFEHPITDSKQPKYSDYNWEAVEERLDVVHSTLNGVYEDIIQE